MPTAPIVPAGAGALGGRGAPRLGEKLGKDGWTTIGIPDELYSQAKAMIPLHGVSVSEYVRFWVGIGIRIDTAAKAAEIRDILNELIRALEDK